MPAAERIDVTRAVCDTVLATPGITCLLGGTVGVPAPVTVDGRVVVDGPYLPGVAELDLRTALDLAVPMQVANAANLAERWLGVAAGTDDVVLVLAGERLGAGVCLGGRILRGHRGGTGELGFLDLVIGDDPTARDGGADGIGRLVRRWGSDALGRPVGAEEVFDAARRGESWAREVLDAVARRIARALAVLASLLDPEVIVVGGAVAGAREHLLIPLEQEFARVSRRPARLATSTLADRGVLLGAVRATPDDVRPRLWDLAQS